MDKENNIYEKTKYEYGICNVLYKNLEKDKVYRIEGRIYYRYDIKFKDTYIIDNEKEICVNDIRANYITFFMWHNIELIESKENKFIKNIFGKV